MMADPDQLGLGFTAFFRSGRYVCGCNVGLFCASWHIIIPTSCSINVRSLPQNTNPKKSLLICILFRCSISDAKLRILLAAHKASGGGKEACHTDKGDWEEVLCIPVHKVVLMAKCAYFNTLLCTAIGKSSTAVITEHAGSREEVQSIVAAAECVYTGKMPLCYATISACGEGSCAKISSQVQKHIKTLEVSGREAKIRQYWTKKSSEWQLPVARAQLPWNSLQYA